MRGTGCDVDHVPAAEELDEHRPQIVARTEHARVVRRRAVAGRAQGVLVRLLFPPHLAEPLLPLAVDDAAGLARQRHVRQHVPADQGRVVVEDRAWEKQVVSVRGFKRVGRHSKYDI